MSIMHDEHHIENGEEFKGLTVNNGINEPPKVNPYLKLKKRREYSADDYVDGILRGDKSILAQAVTLIESTKPEHQGKAQQVIERCLPNAGRSVRIGITGVPGAGKSTFIDVFGMNLINLGKKVAVLAIDPSSERSKGSILGDKTRMETLSAQANAFIRPSPSAGSLGGVARKTRETIVLCEAAGFDTILIETVGVGQSETAMHRMVDFFLLLQVAGTGDELQGIKRGIMEMADGIVVNKCDGNNVERAELAKTQLKNALMMFPPHDSGWTPQVLTCSAYEGTHIHEIWQMISEYVNYTQKNHYFDFNRRKQGKYWMYETIDDKLKSHFYNNAEIEKKLTEYEKLVDNNEISSFNAAARLLDIYFKENHQ